MVLREEDPCLHQVRCSSSGLIAVLFNSSVLPTLTTFQSTYKQVNHMNPCGMSDMNSKRLRFDEMYQAAVQLLLFHVCSEFMRQNSSDSIDSFTSVSLGRKWIN